MNTIPHRDMERTLPDYDAKTRESPFVKPTPPPEPLAFGWRLRHLDYGPDGKAAIYDLGDHSDVVVTRSLGSIDVESTDTAENRRRLSYLFGYFERTEGDS